MIKDDRQFYPYAPGPVEVKVNGSVFQVTLPKCPGVKNVYLVGTHLVKHPPDTWAWVNSGCGTLWLQPDSYAVGHNENVRARWPFLSTLQGVEGWGWEW